MKQYVDLVKHVLEEGTLKQNRTGVDTLGVFGYHYKHDLNEGFPLLTTKKMKWEHIVLENLWFLSGSDEAAFLRHYNIKFWEPWTDDTGRVANCYGPAWTRYKPARQLEPVDAREPTGDDYVKPVFEVETTEFDHVFCGQLFESANCGEFKVVRHTGKDSEGRALFDVQFLNTGYVAKGVRKDVISAGTIKDPYNVSVSGMGYRGEGGPHLTQELRKNLHKVWAHMLERCYVQTCKEYAMYGARGIRVCNKWLNFSEFLKDCTTLPDWSSKREDPAGYALDKDYYGASVYSPSTCVWLPHAENRLYAFAQPVRVTHPEMGTFISESITNAAEVTGVGVWRVNDALERNTRVDDYEFNKLKERYRYPLPINQIRWAVDELRRNPLSRRVVITAWDPRVALTAPLPPCHVTWVLNTQRDKTGELCLNLALLQRSCDGMLGVPYNLAGYSFLLHLMAHLTNLKVGAFSHTLVDAHIYVNHLEGAREQIQRACLPLPKLCISPDIKELSDIEDVIASRPALSDILDIFKLENYEAHPAIPYPIAV